jgi:hypothetical protein
MLRCRTFVFLSLLASSVARAAGPSAEEIEAAKHRIAQGNQLYDEGRYSDALQSYVAAYDLLPSPDILFNIGLAQEKVLHFEECAVALKRYLASNPPAGDTRDRAQQRLDACRAKALVKVTITSIPPGAAVSLGQGAAQPIFKGRTPTELDLPPDKYAIAVALPGYLPMSQAVDVDVGDKPEIDFPLEKLSTLEIATDQPGATVQIGDLPPGPAPLKKELRAGTYPIVVDKPGFVEIKRDVQVEAGQQARLELALAPQPIVKRFALRADASEATVAIDGGPPSALPVNETLKAGPHRVEVRATGHIPFARDVNVTGTSDLDLRVHLAKPRTRAQTAVVWGLAGLAAVLAGAGTAYGALALADHGTFDSMPSLELAERGESRAARADALFGLAGGVALAALLVDLATAPGSSSISSEEAP